MLVYSESVSSSEEKERVLALPCLQFNMLIDVYLSHACAIDIIDVQIGS